MTLKLYELASEYERFGDLAVESVEDTAQDETQALELLLESVRDEESTKVLALAKVILSLEAEASVLEQQAGRLMGRARARHSRSDFLKNWMKLTLESIDMSRVKDAFVTVWLQSSPPSVEVLDETTVPAEFQRAVLRLPFAFVPPGLRGYLQHLDVDKVAILAQVKRTGEVPAGVSVRTTEKHVRLR
jgi:predicted hydrocarbon binding protein